MAAENSGNITFLEKIFPFSLLDQTTLQKISGMFERVSFPADTRLFNFNDPAESLFFILSGSVKILKGAGKSSSGSVILSAGDRFGEESLNRHSLYETTAVTETRVVVLVLSQFNIQRLLASFSLIRSAFSLLYQTWRLSSKLKLSWKGSDESILLISRRHPFFLYLRIFLVGGAFLFTSIILFFFAFASSEMLTVLLVFAILALLVGAVITGWAAFEWTNDYFIITHDRVLVEKKLVGFFENRQESPMSAILSTGVIRSFFGRLIGFGTITLRSYTGDLHFDRLPNPDLIYELLENHRLQIQQAGLRNEQAGMRGALLDQMNSTATSPNNMNSSETDLPQNEYYDSGSLSDGMARFFKLRRIERDSIVYHTHWWILWKKTLLPGFCIFILVMLDIIRLLGFMDTVTVGNTLLASLILGFICLVWWIYQYEDWNNDVYVLTTDQLIDVSRKPLGTENRRTAPIKNIQTVEFTRKGLTGLLFNFGTVHIKIGTEELTFDNVYSPSKVQSEIYLLLKKYTDSQKRSEQQRFADWIRTYDEIKEEKKRTSSSSRGDENG